MCKMSSKKTSKYENMSNIRPPYLYGICCNYALELLCPVCKRKQAYCPRRAKGEQYARIKKNAKKKCIVCGNSFSIQNNILGERDIKTK